MTIHWKAAEQYFTLVLFVNTLVLFVFQPVSQFLILEPLPILDLELSGVKELIGYTMNILLTVG